MIGLNHSRQPSRRGISMQHSGSCFGRSFRGAVRETLAGLDRIREVLAGLIRKETHLHSRVVRAVIAGDVALLYTDFEGTTRPASGEMCAVNHKAVEVLQRQADGTWKLTSATRT